MSGQRQRGMILITSLVFLVVLTLLAVTAINSATLQSRMAGNQRSKARALEDANSALAYIESVLGSPDFLRCNPAFAGGDDPPADCTPDSASLPVRSPGTDAPDNPDYFLADDFWQRGGVGSYTSPGSPDAPVEYVVEYLHELGGNLDPSAPATTLFFRITARARDKSPAASATVQSVYEIVR